MNFTKLVNLVLYQIGWWGCVLGGAWNFPHLGAGLALLLVGVHLLLVADRRAELRLILLAGGLGMLADTLLVQGGMIVFSHGAVVTGFTTPWMVVLWLQFSTLLRFSLAWLQMNLPLSALQGALAGPLAYGAGERLGAIRFPAGALVSLACIAAIWMTALPVLVHVARRRKGSFTLARR